MKLLFTMDAKNYDPSWPKFYRPSVRGIIINPDHRITLIYSKKYHFYKIPGGGIENNEDHLTTLIREVNEETGLTVIPESVREFGEVLRIHKSGELKNTIFVQPNFYYFCQTTGRIGKQHLDTKEKKAEFVLKETTLDEAIQTNLAFISDNSNSHHDEFIKDMVDMVDREYRILKLLKEYIVS